MHILDWNICDQREQENDRWKQCQEEIEGQEDIHPLFVGWLLTENER